MITWRPEGKHKSIISSSSWRISLKIARSRLVVLTMLQHFFCGNPSITIEWWTRLVFCRGSRNSRIFSGFYRVDVMKEANEVKMNLDITRWNIVCIEHNQMSVKDHDMLHRRLTSKTGQQFRCADQQNSHLIISASPSFLSVVFWQFFPLGLLFPAFSSSHSSALRPHQGCMSL